MKLSFSARSPFSLAPVVRSHGWVQLAPFDSPDHDSGFSYVARMESGRVIEWQIKEAEEGVNVEVDYPLSEVEQSEIRQKIDWMLGLNQDFSTFYALARKEPKLARVEERAQGRLLRSPTLFEDTVKTILTTNTTWRGTIRMVEALVSGFGSPLLTDPARHAFPTPEQLAQADVGALRLGAKLGYRAPYVLELARLVVSSDLDLEAYKTSPLPTLELRKQLLAIKGVGGYAAANLLMLLGRYDFVPVDSWALKMVSHEWYDGQPVGPAEVESAFAGWGNWKGLAYWFWDWAYNGEG